MSKDNFTEDDYNKFQEVLKFILNRANWSLTTREALDLNKHLGFLNSINDKIQKNVLEVVKVVEPEKKKGKKK